MGHDQQHPPATKPDGDRFGLEEPAGNGHSTQSYAALAQKPRARRPRRRRSARVKAKPAEPKNP